MNLTTVLSVSAMFPIVTYHVQDALIEDVIENQPLTYVYNTEDIFNVFDRILDTSLDNNSYTQNHTTTQLVSYLSGVLEQNSPLSSEDKDVIFRNFLALPLYISNARQILPDNINIDLLPSNMSVMGYTASASYRIAFSRFAIATFTTIVGVTLVFCVTALFYCLLCKSLVPNISDFPEIDFAAKALSGTNDVEDGDMNLILERLGNARTTDIGERLKGKSMLVGAEDKRVVMRTVMKNSGRPETIQRLQKGPKYY